MAGFIFLSVRENKIADISRQNSWTLYFKDPKNTSLDFTIENHSDNSNFRWEISVSKNKIQEGNVTVKNGETKTIPVSVEDMTDKKITITVIQEENKKEIYKSL
jgi:VCBS repeat-containing protein